MSRSATAVSPGNTNRRFIMLALFLGLIGAVLVYVAFSRPAGSGSGSGANVPVVVAKEEIPARTTIVASMLEVRLVPMDARSEFAYSDTAAAINQVARFPIAANEQVLSTKIVDLSGTSSAAGTSRALSFVVPQGMRGIAIQASEVQNAGGLLLPGDYVDILVVSDVEFVKPGGNFGEREKIPSYFVQTLLQRKEVLAIAQGVVDLVAEATPTTGGQRVRNTEGKPDPGASTVTLALTPEEAQKVYLAELTGKIRLSLRHYGDNDEPVVDFLINSDILPKNLPNPFLR